MAGTKTITGDAMALTGQTLEVNKFGANNISLEAKGGENALAAAMGRTAGASETTSEPKLDNNPVQDFDSPQVQERTKELREQKARLEKNITLYDAKTNRLKALDMEQSRQAREGLQLIIAKNKQLQQSSEIAKAVSGPLTNPSIEPGGGKGHQIYNTGLHKRLSSLIQNNSAERWEKTWSGKSYKVKAMQQLKIDRTTIGATVVGE